MDTNIPSKPDARSGEQPAMSSPTTVVIGTGIVGIATAYYLAKQHGQGNIALVDRSQPMTFTSAQSGENYRNWWSHPTMVDFTNRSIALLEEIARDSGNRINMTRRGYALATRESDIDTLVAELRKGFGDKADALLRFHTGASAPTYYPFEKPDWKGVPDGVDIVQNQDLIRSRFPSFDHEVRSIIHVRRGGDISGQQLGMYMLEYLREAGAVRVIGEVQSIAAGEGFRVEVSTPDGVKLPVQNVLQQKISFEDSAGAVPRALPFSIDLDPQFIDWTEEERAMLRQDPDAAWMAETMPGSIHCRPDGGDGGKWIKIGWAFNDTPSEANWEPALNDNFPDIVLRGASRLTPALKIYYGRLPRGMHHYGGYYTMTKENWPLIGPMGPEGAFMNCALSGYGTMSACAAGELCAAWIADAPRPAYADGFSMARYSNAEMMASLLDADKGVL
jgi:glycine/D-amino acid oxidase-like deaminating enzyme